MHGIAMGLFEHLGDAEGAIQDLLNAGFERYDISVLEGGSTQSLLGADLLKEEADFLQDSLGHGAVVVALRTDATARAVGILERRGAVDARQAIDRWRREGWAGFTSRGDPARQPTVDVPGESSQPQVVVERQGVVPPIPVSDHPGLDTPSQEEVRSRDIPDTRKQIVD